MEINIDWVYPLLFIQMSATTCLSRLIPVGLSHFDATSKKIFFSLFPAQSRGRAMAASGSLQVFGDDLFTASSNALDFFTNNKSYNKPTR